MSSTRTIAQPDLRTLLQGWIPKLVLAPSLAVTLLFVYGFIGFSIVLSFTGSAIPSAPASPPSTATKIPVTPSRR